MPRRSTTCRASASSITRSMCRSAPPRCGRLAAMPMSSRSNVSWTRWRRPREADPRRLPARPSVRSAGARRAGAGARHGGLGSRVGPCHGRRLLALQEHRRLCRHRGRSRDRGRYPGLECLVCGRCRAADQSGRRVEPDRGRHRPVDQLDAQGTGRCFDHTSVTSRSWATYPILRFGEVPDITVEFITDQSLPPLGVGEASQGPTAAALANAVAKALGVRVRDLPISRERLIAAS